VPSTNTEKPHPALGQLEGELEHTDCGARGVHGEVEAGSFDEALDGGDFAGDGGGGGAELGGVSTERRTRLIKGRVWTCLKV
jgi:hypothetical protein